MGLRVEKSFPFVLGLVVATAYLLAYRNHALPKTLLSPHSHDAEADVVITPLGLEPLPEGRSGGPGIIGPCAAPARSGEGAIPIRRCCGQRLLSAAIIAVPDLFKPQNLRRVILGEEVGTLVTG